MTQPLGNLYSGQTLHFGELVTNFPNINVQERPVKAALWWSPEVLTGSVS